MLVEKYMLNAPFLATWGESCSAWMCQRPMRFGRSQWGHRGFLDPSSRSRGALVCCIGAAMLLLGTTFLEPRSILWHYDRMKEANRRVLPSVHQLPEDLPFRTQPDVVRLWTRVWGGATITAALPPRVSLRTYRHKESLSSSKFPPFTWLHVINTFWCCPAI